MLLERSSLPATTYENRPGVIHLQLPQGVEHLLYVIVLLQPVN